MKKIILFLLSILSNQYIQSANALSPQLLSVKKRPNFESLKSLFGTTRFDRREFNAIFPQIKDDLTLDQIDTIRRLNGNQKSRWTKKIAEILEKLDTQKRQGPVDSSSLQDSLEQEQGSFVRLNESLSDPEAFIKILGRGKLTFEEIESLQANNRLGLNFSEIEDALNKILQQRNAEMLSSLQESLQESTQGPSPEPLQRAIIAAQEPGLTPQQSQDLADALL
jgi:hypothetical protein